MALPLPSAGLDAHACLEVCLLGQFSAAVDGVALGADKWPSLRARQLVQLLSLGPRKRLTRDEVIDAL